MHLNGQMHKRLLPAAAGHREEALEMKVKSEWTQGEPLSAGGQTETRYFLKNIRKKGLTNGMGQGIMPIVLCGVCVATGSNCTPNVQNCRPAGDGLSVYC